MYDDQPPDESGLAARADAPSSDTVRGRFGYVDALRGIAIVAMVLYEMHHHGVIIADGVLGHIFNEGSRGIDIFFVVSGFALAYPALSVLRADGRAGLDLGRYAIRRIARIVPAAWVTIACLAIAPALIAVANLHPTMEAFRQALPPTGQTLREIFFLQPPAAAPDAFWVIAVAIRWYVLFPALILLWTKSQRAFLAVGVAVVILDPLTRLHGLGLGELPAFMLGIVAADWRVRHEGFARWSLYLAVLAALIGVAIEPLFNGPMFAFAPFPADNLAWQAAAFFLLTGIGHFEAAERAFDRAFFATAGSASYSVALVVEAVTEAAGPFAQHLSSLGSRTFARGFTFQGGGAASRVSRALSTGTPIGRGLEIVFVALCVLVAGLLLYRAVDRNVFERDPRMRLADRLEPLLARLFSMLRTTGVLVLGNRNDDLRFEATASSGAEFYAPPPRGDSTGYASVTKHSGSSQDLEEEMIAAKKRLADRTAAMFADAEYEANRAKGIVTPGASIPVTYPFQMPGPPLANTSAPVYGEARDVWQKPRSADAPPAPPGPVPIDAFEADEAPREPEVLPHAPAVPLDVVAEPAPTPVVPPETPPVAPPAAATPYRITPSAPAPPTPRPRPIEVLPRVGEHTPSSPVDPPAPAFESLLPIEAPPAAAVAPASPRLLEPVKPIENVEPEAPLESVAAPEPDRAPAESHVEDLPAEVLPVEETPVESTEAAAPVEPPSVVKPPSPIRFKIGGPPPGTKSAGEKSPGGNGVEE